VNTPRGLPASPAMSAENENTSESDSCTLVPQQRFAKH
jgi:hypothetical protein